MIIRETEKDPVLASLKQHIRQDYMPNNIKELKPFQKIYNELAISDEELILKSEKIILPESLHNLALDKAHQGHPGMNGLKRHLPSHFWLPKMDKIESNL